MLLLIFLLWFTYALVMVAIIVSAWALRAVLWIIGGAWHLGRWGLKRRSEKRRRGSRRP